MGNSLITDAFLNGFRPRDSRPIYEWAKEHVILKPPLTRTGPFDVGISRHFIGPFDALKNDRVREVSVLAPPRSGKTLISDIWLPWLAVNSPGPFRWVFQDEKAAEDHEANRAKPTLRSVAALAKHVPERGRLNNIAGMVAAIDGPAIGNLNSRGYQFMSFDEVWLWEQGMLDEAKARQGDFKVLQNNKGLFISQGGDPGSDWDIHYHAAVGNDWNIQCQGCGKHWPPVWTGFRADGTRYGARWDEKKDSQGFWDIPKAVPTMRVECPHCGHVDVDTTLVKSRWNLTGKYVAEETDKNDRRQAFHWHGLIFFPWEEMLEQYLSAMNQLKMGNPLPLIKFLQKQCAEFSNEQTAFQGSRVFATSVYEIKSDWADEDERYMTVDCQREGVYYATIRAWSKRARQSRRLWRGILHGESDIAEKQAEFKVPACWVVLDSGDRAKGPGGVYAMCIRNGWIAMKGVGTINGQINQEGFWHTVEIIKAGGEVERIRVLRSYAEPVPADPETGETARANLIKFSSDHVADSLDGLISSGHWIEPEDDGSPEEREYRLSMSSEFVKIKVDKFSGLEIKKRVCPSKKNHYYDCGKMQNATAIVRGMITDPLDDKVYAQKKAA